MKKPVYSKPKVCKSKKGWYVHFRINGKQKRYKYGLNYIKNLTERSTEANNLATALYRKLKNGWNPYTEVKATNNKMLFLEALDFALDKKKEHLAPKTYLGYKGTIRFISKATNDLTLDFLEIKETKRVHIRTIMEKVKKQRNWSNMAYNKNLNYLKAVLSELIQWDILETNPAHQIKNLKVQESRANVPPTLDEHQKIKHCLESNHPHFYIFILTIFHTGIRPKEILQLKLDMIDLEKQQIILPPEITKTNKERIVPINNHLLEHYQSMELNIYPSDFYLFGSYRQKGKGNVGKHIDFIPGFTQIKRDTSTKRWHKIVKQGLGINVNMYAYKHFGANQKILAGIDLDVLRELYGHSSKLMTMRYAKVVKEVYRNEIIQKSPKF